MKFLENIAGLIKVKTIVTLVVIGVFALLALKIIKVDYIKPVSDFLLSIMPVTFIGPGVALITILADLREMLLPILLAVTVSTAVVMGAVAIVVEKMQKDGKQADSEEKEVLKNE